MKSSEKTSFIRYPFSDSDLKGALGGFATGITIVTAKNNKNQNIGITVNSFSSVSLDPPLVLWSIAKSAKCFHDFFCAEYYAIHILGEDQKFLSDQFASKDADKFYGLACAEGIAGIPLLPSYNVCFQCKFEHRYEGGDHIIIVGRIHALSNRSETPLLYLRGTYGSFVSDA
ncbi:MAG: nitrilotriacetate monooxygenase [Cellvibrionales bacterium TMED49]|nr:nitrilotriacetate monooxygenase [Porticoccaceae bacterium]OUU38545.1 MAG: nitrilotriacetate monooxygenase [Cellvibrionales bacterium TMED49]|tara:strand:- start:527 stop:1042 length:516 start_codon:yes stop_codon:yes gene_type:complete